MAKNLFITSINAESGKSAVAFGVMELLLRDIRKVRFFKPIINPRKHGEKDQDDNLIHLHFHLGLQYNETYAVTQGEAKHYINSGRQNDLIKIILYKYQQLEEKCNFVLYEGTDFISGHGSFNCDIDAAIAADFSCPAFIVNGAPQTTVEEIVSLCHLAIGPILQDLNKHVNDLSRGCRFHDIVNTVAITAIHAYASKIK